MSTVAGMRECPFCGAEDFYVKVDVKGKKKSGFKLDGVIGRAKLTFSFIGEPKGNDKLDGLKLIRGRVAFCSECNAIVGLATHAD